jgi:DNA-binding beta-propeller fold protein YncE
LKKSLITILIFLVVLFGCQAAISTLRPPLEEEGEVYLYMQPFPQEAERLRFKIEAIYALSGDGKEYPLSISLGDLKSPDVRRQRLLASGRLPPGPFGGLSFKVKDAILRREDGEATLKVPEGPVRIDFAFNIVRKRSSLIAMVFKYPESIIDRFSFSPVFSLYIPSKPITNLAGYVTNSGSNNITIFDKKLGQAVGVIATGRKPQGMALDQRLRRAYVALSGDDTIGVIDVTAGEIIDRIRLNTGDRPQDLALTSDGRILLSVNNGSNTLSFIDPISLFELRRLDVGNGPNSVLIDSTGKRAFVFNTLSSTLSVIDIPNKAIVTTIATEPGPLRGQFNRRGDRLYIIHEWSSYLTVLDPVSLSLQRRFSVRMGMVSIKVDTNTDLVYMGRKVDTVVEVYDPFSFVPVDYIKTGAGITYMTIDGEENNLYMINPEMKLLVTANLVSRKLFFEIDVGEGPYWITIMGEK